MNKIFVINRISIDGYFSNNENVSRPEWFLNDTELDKWMMTGQDFMNPTSYLFGRITYQNFEKVWPNVTKMSNLPEEVIKMASALNKMKKYVCSRTLKKVTWENSFLLKDNIIESVKKLKEENDGDFLIFGSGTIVQTLAHAKLIDEYLLIVTPIILGKGKALFNDTAKTNLDLVQAIQFKSGNVLLHYKISKN